MRGAGPHLPLWVTLTATRSSRSHADPGWTGVGDSAAPDAPAAAAALTAAGWLGPASHGGSPPRQATSNGRGGGGGGGWKGECAAFGSGSGMMLRPADADSGFDGSEGNEGTCAAGDARNVGDRCCGLRLISAAPIWFSLAENRGWNDVDSCESKVVQSLRWCAELPTNGLDACSFSMILSCKDSSDLVIFELVFWVISKYVHC